MKMKTVFITATVVAGAFVLGSVVVAHESGDKAGMRSHHGSFEGGPGSRHGAGMLMGKRMMRELGLTPEQEDAMQDVMENARPQMHELHTARRDNQQRLMVVSPDDPAYASVVDEVAQANAELASRTTRLATQMQSEVWALLTDAQKVRAEELKVEMMVRMAERRAKRLERRGPPADASK